MSTAEAARPLGPRQLDHRVDGGLLPAPVIVRRTGPPDVVAGSPTVEAQTWAAHRRRWPVRPRGGPWLAETAAAAGLSGRGGGDFPAARKWRAALSAQRRLTVVANAAESETLSAKDATLLRLRPHLVLDGLALLTETLGASSAVLWIHDCDTTTVSVVQGALQDRARTGLDELPVSIRAVSGGYLAGESSAIKHALEGGPLLPRFEQAGVSRGDRSTLVHNVETLARLAVLSRSTPAHSGRTPAVQPQHRGGTRLLTVLTPHDRRVVEAGAEERLGEVVTRVAGQPPPGAAVLLAGFGGTWARWSDVAGARADEGHLRTLGLSLGAGVVAPLWADTCGVSVTAAIVAYLTRASARQCGPCLFGLPALAEGMAQVRDGTARRATLAQMEDDLALVDGRGACHHPDGVVRLVRSALKVFADDVADHLAGSPCAHGADTIPVPGR